MEEIEIPADKKFMKMTVIKMKYVAYNIKFSINVI